MLICASSSFSFSFFLLVNLTPCLDCCICGPSEYHPTYCSPHSCFVIMLHSFLWIHAKCTGGSCQMFYQQLIFHSIFHLQMAASYSPDTSEGWKGYDKYQCWLHIDATFCQLSLIFVSLCKHCYIGASIWSQGLSNLVFSSSTVYIQMI